MSAPIAVIDTGICNLRSVTKALEAVGASPVVVRTPAEVDACGRRGARAARGGRAARLRLLAARVGPRRDGQGMDRPRPALPRRVPGHAGALRRVRGGRGEGAGHLPGACRALQRCRRRSRSPTWAGTRSASSSRTARSRTACADEGESFYFVHSFHCVPQDRALVLAECDYGGPFVAAIARGRVFATQFHPEKSQAKGLADLSQFRGISRQLP